MSREGEGRAPGALEGGPLVEVLDALVAATRADAASIATIDEAGAIAIAAHRGLSPAVATMRWRADAEPRFARALAGGAADATAHARPTRLVGAPEPDPFDGLLLGDRAPVDAIHACTIVPVLSGDRAVALITLDARQPRGLDAASDELLAAHAAIVRAVLGRAPRPCAPPSRAARGSPIVGGSSALEALRREIEVVAPLATTVLVLGESGVGKELVARELHARSLRAHKPLVTVNAAALPDELTEAELFGHTRGAFTGASAARAGRFEAADGGTLFLDEIGEVSLALQARLLRAIEYGEIQRVGEDRARKVDVRIVAATNRDLEDEVRAGRFRADLFHRLWVYPLVVPPLRDRPADLPALSEHLARELARTLGVPAISVADDAMRAILRHPWPGNVRELRNVLERAAIARLVELRGGDGRGHRGALVLRARDLRLTRAAASRAAADPSDAPSTLEHAVDEARREAFVAAMRASDGRIAEAARVLGVSRSFAFKEARRLGLVGAARPR